MPAERPCPQSGRAHQSADAVPATDVPGIAHLIANALRGYHIGLDEEADGVWSIFFDHILRAKLDERDYIIRE